MKKNLKTILFSGLIFFGCSLFAQTTQSATNEELQKKIEVNKDNPSFNEQDLINEVKKDEENKKNTPQQGTAPSADSQQEVKQEETAVTATPSKIRVENGIFIIPKSELSTLAPERLEDIKNNPSKYKIVDE